MIDISIRQSKFALVGLKDMIDYINNKSDVPTKKMTMVEIGSYVGDSTRIFAQHFEKVISVDPYKNGYDDTDTSSHKYPMEQIFLQFKRNVLDKFPNVVHFRGTSEEAALTFEGDYDFVYIDGNHQLLAVKKDIEMWLPKSKLWLGGHDYGRVKLMVDKLIQPDETFKDSSWVRKIQ